MENWQRLEQVIRWSGMSVNAFALHIGLKRSENLYQIKKGNHGISKELANVISEKYPNISRSWLLTGEGSMLRDAGENIADTGGIPFYNVDIASISEFGYNALRPIYHINIPVFNECDFACLNTSNAMYPDIPTGAMIILKEHSPERILPGESYLIVTEDFSGVRFIRNHPSDSSVVRLVPKNTDDYDEITISISEIKTLYLIKGVLISKSL